MGNSWRVWLVMVRTNSPSPCLTVKPEAAVLRVQRRFPGSTVLCVACGPSLTREDVEACRGRLPVLVVNDAYQLAPWADALYAADDHWWHAHRGAPSFQGEKYSIELRIDLDRIKHLQRTYP